MGQADYQDATGHRERMRTRLLNGGGDALLDVDSLEYLLALAIPRKDVKPLARYLLDEFGSYGRVISANNFELARLEGMGPSAVAALRLVQDAALRLLREEFENRPLISSWRAVLDYVRAAMGYMMIENFRVLFINNRNILIRDEVMSEGTVDRAAVYPREILKRALELGATAVALAHNHPSGDITPSREDIDLTVKIETAGRPLGVRVHDHVIVSHGHHVSFRALGLMH